jgi:hypothetical protein
MTARLSEGTCIGDLSWTDTAWTMRWSDGAADVQPGSGQQGIIDAHTLPADPTATTQTAQADVTAIAHLHLTGTAIDFDADGNLVTVPRSADVDISNKQFATGVGAGPVYTPPRLAAAAVASGQRGDGSILGLDPAAPALTHADTIRGRLLALYPRALVVSPGTESIDGVTVGEGRSTTIGWTYLGGGTDAPPGEATVPGLAAAASQPVIVQYNHAERLDAHGDPVDELVPLVIQVHTVYPDGHAEDESVSGAITVSIYYTGLQTAG